MAWAILSTWGWRWLVAVSSLPLLALLLLYGVLPESPYWLLATGRTAAAEALLQRIAAANRATLPRGRLRPAAAAAKVGPWRTLVSYTPEALLSLVNSGASVRLYRGRHSRTLWALSGVGQGLNYTSQTGCVILSLVEGIG